MLKIDRIIPRPYCISYFSISLDKITNYTEILTQKVALCYFHFTCEKKPGYLLEAWKL